MFIFIGVLVAAFRAVGKSLSKNESAPVELRFLSWTLGAILFGHVANFFSISYFDQSIIFLYLVLASISTVQLAKSSSDTEAEQPPALRLKQSRYATGASKNEKKKVAGRMLCSL